MNSKDHGEQSTSKVKTARAYSSQLETSPSDKNFSYKHIGQRIIHGDVQLPDKHVLHHAKAYERSASAMSAHNGKDLAEHPEEQLQQFTQNSQKRTLSNASKQKIQLQMINNSNLLIDRSPSAIRKQDTLMGTLLGNKTIEYSSNKKMSTNPGDSSQKYSDSLARRDTVTLLTTSQENLYLEKKIKSLENNARYFESQAHPLFVENFNLKDQIISLTESIKIMTKLIATMVKGKSPAGQSREMVKKIGDFEQLIVCLQEDMERESKNNTELQTTKEQLLKDLSCLREDIQVMKATHVQEVQELRKKYEDQRSQLECDYECKLAVLSKDLNSKIDELQSQNAKQAADLKDKIEQINNLIPLMEDWKGRAKRAQNELSNMLVSFEDEKQAMKMSHSQALKDLQDYQKIQLEKAAQELRNYGEQRDAKDDILQAEIKERKEEIDYLQRELKECREDNEKLNGIIEEKMNNIGEMLGKLKNQQEEGEKQLEMIASQESQIKELNFELLKCKRENENCNDEIRNLKEKQGALEEKMQAEERLSEKQSERYQEELETQRIRCKEEIEQLKQQHVSDMMEVKLKQEKELADLAERLTKDKKGMLDQLESDQRMILNSMQERLRDMGKENDKLQEKLEEVIKANNLKLQMDQANYQQGTQKLRDQIDQLLSEKRLENEVVEQKTKRLNEQIEQLNQEKINKAKEFEREMLRAVSQETARMEELRAVMEEQWRVKMEELEKNQKNALDKLFSENKSASELFVQQLHQLEKKSQDQLEALKVELNAAQERLLKDLKAQHTQQLEKLTTENSQKIVLLQKEWEQKITLAKDDFSAKLNALEEDLQNSQSRIKDLEQNLFDTRRTYESRLLEGQDALLKEKSKLHDQQEKELGDLRVALSSLERIVGELQGQRAELQETKGDLQNRLLVLKQQLIDFQRQHTLQLQQVQTDKQAAQASSKEKEELLKQQCQAQINEISLAQLKLMDTLKLEFEGIKLANSNILKLEQEKYAELAKLFKERPSRKEDMVLIKNAQDQVVAQKAEVTEAEQKVSSAKQLVKYLQLELENYKNNYDIFGPNQGYSYQHQQSLLKLFRQQDILSQSKVQHEQIVTQQLQMKQPQYLQQHQQQQHNQQQLLGLLQQQPSLIMKGSRQLIKQQSQQQQQQQQQLNPIQLIQQDKQFQEQQKVQQQYSEKLTQYQQAQQQAKATATTTTPQQEQTKSQCLSQHSQQQLQHQNNKNNKSHSSNHHNNQQPHPKQQLSEQFTPWEQQQQTENYRTRRLDASSIEIISEDFFGKPILERLDSTKKPQQQQQQSKDSIMQHSRNDMSNSSFNKNLSKSRKLVRRRSKTLTDVVANDANQHQTSQTINNDKEVENCNSNSSNFRVFDVNSRNNSAILGNFSGSYQISVVPADDVISQGLLISGSNNGISLRANSNNDVSRYANSSSNILPMFLNPFENDNLMRNAEVFVEHLQKKKLTNNTNSNNLSNNSSNQKPFLSISKSVSPRKQCTDDQATGKTNSKDGMKLSGKQIKLAESKEEIGGTLQEEQLCSSDERLTTQEKMFQNSSSSFKKSAGGSGSKKYWRQKSYHNNSVLMQETIEKVEDGFD